MSKVSDPFPNCPWCQSDLNITEYACGSCRNTFAGNVPQVTLPRWNADEWDVIRTFLLSEGNYQQASKMIGVSYPTLKSRLADALKKIPIDSSKAPKPGTVKEALTQLSEGKLSKNQAEAIIKKLTRGG